MGSLAEREGLRNQVQCIYVDPPYGIKFNSNFQWSTTQREVKDGDTKHITREPEQVKAFRDTWRDGIHSYLGYLRDRLTIARDLLLESGSIFVQIGDANSHRVRNLLDEIFGDGNFIAAITFTTKGNQKGTGLQSITDNLLWYAKDSAKVKRRDLYALATESDAANRNFGYINYSGEDFALGDFLRKFDLPPETDVDKVEKIIPGAKAFTHGDATTGGLRPNQSQLFRFQGRDYDPGVKRGRSWTHTSRQRGDEKYCGMDRLAFSGRLFAKTTLLRKTYLADSGVTRLTNVWTDVRGAFDKSYVVQTSPRIVERCILLASDPGDLILDPTCGSGTTALVAEQWGRRWITIDSSRVALALARARIMGARFPYYILADSEAGQIKEAEVTRTIANLQPSFGNIRRGFVNQRLRHITSTVVANNSQIDAIWDSWQAKLEPLRASINAALNRAWEEWEVPRVAHPSWPANVANDHKAWWSGKLARQQEIDASIFANAEYEYLYDKPYEDKKIVRVAGPFTVESSSPHRTLTVGDGENSQKGAATPYEKDETGSNFTHTILENLKTSGVQQAKRDDKIIFTSVLPWPGQEYICAEGRYQEYDAGPTVERRAAIFIGPEFGTVTKPDLTAAAREAADAGFDVLIACAFAYDAYSSEFKNLGRLQVLKARMNADLHMAEDLKKTEKANLFVIFGEPDIDVLDEGDKVRVKINGVDVFVPGTGEVRSDGPDGIACWFVDTDYNEESFFVRHAYFLGANDPYDALKKTLKAEIDEEAWSSLNSDTSRPFAKPSSGRIAVKVINHLGDEVMKVFKVA